MIIGVDIDDTLTNLNSIVNKHVFRFAKENNLKIKLVNKYDAKIKNRYDWSKEVCEKFWKEKLDNLIRASKPKKNAKKVLDKLKADGHKIYIITARNSNDHIDPKALTEDWLKKYNFNYDKLFTECLDKTPTCINEKVEVFIDDNLKHLTALKNTNIVTMQMKSTANSKDNFDGIKVKSWNQVYKIIKNLNLKNK